MANRPQENVNRVAGLEAQSNVELPFPLRGNSLSACGRFRLTLQRTQWVELQIPLAVISWEQTMCSSRFGSAMGKVFQHLQISLDIPTNFEEAESSYTLWKPLFVSGKFQALSFIGVFPWIYHMCIVCNRGPGTQWMLRNTLGIFQWKWTWIVEHLRWCLLLVV